ncbi:MULTISPECIES: hypothetical protein [unclassified Streptomyces]|uniref:hypothetical protein n=1 Tax=unclassified Streptomyces TaxID=2593676 RepID=UPI0037F39A29
MSATSPGARLVDLQPRRITPRRLGAAAVVYGVFVAGWYLGQPVTPECRTDQAALDRAAERYAPEPSPTPPPTPMSRPAPAPSRPSLTDFAPAPSAYPDLASPGAVGHTVTLTATIYSVACANDTSERPRLGAWFEGDWR